MLKQLPIKKEYLLAIASVVLLLICYQLAFKKTIAAWQINKTLKTQTWQTADLSVQPGYIIRKDKNISTIISRYKIDTTNLRSNIISNISIIAQKENVKLVEVPKQDPIYHSDKYIIQKLSFEGDFFALTKMLAKLQSTDNIGFVRSASYRLVKTRLTSGDLQKILLDCYIEVLK